MGSNTKAAVRDVDRGYRRIQQLIKDLAERESYVKVGFLDAGRGGESRGELTNAQIAGVMEFGKEDGSQPPRPAVGPTFDKQRGALGEMSAKLVGGILDGKMTVERALGILGAKLSTEIKKTITTGPSIPPPNAPAVAKRKARLGRGSGGGVRTWIDTGRLIGALTWAVIIERR